MAFIRVKTRGGRRYAYLVESVWRAELGSPRQHVLKYLGPESTVRLEDVPEGHREDEAVLRWLDARGGAPAQDLATLRADLRAILILPDPPLAMRLAKRAIERLGIEVFLEEVARPVLVGIGEDWYAGRVTVADEHIVTRGIADIVRQARTEAGAKDVKPRGSRATVLLANPEGEQHSLALEILECRLLAQGHRAVVCAGGTPRRAIARRARELAPDLVILSATTEATASEALRAAEVVAAEAPGALVVVGGQAWHARSSASAKHARVRVAPAGGMATLDALVEEALARRVEAEPVRANGPEG